LRVGASGVEALTTRAASGHGVPPVARPQLVGAAMTAVEALVWGICARIAWRARRRLAGAAPLAGLVAMSATGMTVYCAAGVGRWLLLPLEPASPPLPWLSALSITHDWLLLGTVAVAVHASRLLAAHEPPPTAWWVGLNYGIAGALGLG